MAGQKKLAAGFQQFVYVPTSTLTNFGNVEYFERRLETFLVFGCRERHKQNARNLKSFVKFPLFIFFVFGCLTTSLFLGKFLGFPEVCVLCHTVPSRTLAEKKSQKLVFCKRRFLHDSRTEYFKILREHSFNIVECHKK